MKLNEMFTPFSKLSYQEKLQFTSEYRTQQELDLARGAMKMAPKKKVSKRNARKVQLDPEKMKVLTKLFGNKLLTKVLK